MKRFLLIPTFVEVELRFNIIFSLHEKRLFPSPCPPSLFKLWNTIICATKDEVLLHVSLSQGGRTGNCLKGICSQSFHDTHQPVNIVATKINVFHCRLKVNQKKSSLTQIWLHQMLFLSQVLLLKEKEVILGFWDT